MNSSSTDHPASSQVQKISLAQFEAVAETYNRAVDETGALGTVEHPEIDIACSSTDWVMPAFGVWAVDTEPWILQAPEGFVVLTKTTGLDNRTVLVHPESMWGFASPIISSQPAAMVKHLKAALIADQGWDIAILTGLAPDGQIEATLHQELHERFPLFSGPEMTRCRIDISAFREQETSKQRRERRRIANRCAEQGVELVDPLTDSDPSVDALFARILNVEAQSWKGLEGSGIIEPTLQRFYRTMLDQLPISRLRLFFARLDGEDIGYILGHVRNDEYRGLQISYADSYRHLSIGSLLQGAEIERAEATGVASYDLGMDMAYKQRWSTHEFTTRTTAVARTADLLGS